MSKDGAWSTAERVARASYGRLVALLAAATGDLVLAEDCLAAAFEQALATWPARGVPDAPEAWLLTVARNRQRDVWRSSAHRLSAPLEHLSDGSRDAVWPLDEVDLDAVGDRRLELMLVCAHPAIDETVRTPLMLQTVLGFDAARIATVLAVPSAAMAKRLVRAKRRIKDARIPFVVPDRHVLAERLPAVLEAIYGCYALTWAEPSDGHDSLAGEARYLAVAVATRLGDDSEAWGLAALLTLSTARARARGEDLVPLDQQDTRTWDPELVAEGESFLRRASQRRPPGRFQLEAAIQAVHVDRARTGTTDAAALRTLYDALLLVAPTLGAAVARAAVIARTEGPHAGLAVLEHQAGATGPWSPAAVQRFQPLHATRADLLARVGRHHESAEAYRVAAALSPDAGTRSDLLRRAERARFAGGS